MGTPDPAISAALLAPLIRAFEENTAALLPTYNVAAIRSHLLAWAAHVEPRLPCTKIELRAFRDGGRPRTAFFPARVADIEKMARWAAKENAAGFNVYLSINPRRAEAKSGTASDVEAAAFIVLDLDDKPDALDRIASVPAKPAFVVITGTVPHIRAHAWWPLRELTRDLAAWKSAMAAIAETFGGDRAMADPARIARLAGTVSYPKPEKRALGYIGEATALCEG